MTPEKIKDECVKTLQKAVVKMTMPEWNQAVTKLPINQQTQALVLLSETQSMRTRLENAVLEEIANKLKQNEKSLVAATKKVKKTLKSIERVARVVKAVNKLLKVVAKIV